MEIRVLTSHPKSEIMSLNELELSGKRVLTRVDFNVPLNESGEITDDTRIRAAIPTIKAIISAGGIPILMSHLGRPKGEEKPELSLSQVVERLSELVLTKVHFVPNCIGVDVVQALLNVEEGEVLLLENLRYHKEETEGNVDFAKQLSAVGEIYVNDAFGTAHRAHASTAIIAQFFEKDKRSFGLLMQKELDAAKQAMENGEAPITAIIGGAKVSGKITIIENLLDKVDHLIIGGGMAYTFLKAQGVETGKSLVEDDRLETAKKVMNLAEEKNTKIHIPVDSIVASEFSNDAEHYAVSNDSIPPEMMGLDIGPESIEKFKGIIQESKTILWNGPMGVFEMENYKNGTVAIAQAVVQATEDGAYSLVGGGDSVAALNQFELSDKVSYVSTGGGAMLELLEGKLLPGIKAILA